MNTTASFARALVLASSLWLPAGPGNTARHRNEPGGGGGAGGFVPGLERCRCEDELAGRSWACFLRWLPCAASCQEALARAVAACAQAEPPDEECDASVLEAAWECRSSCLERFDDCLRGALGRYLECRARCAVAPMASDRGP
jgi:hypothetical protein